MCRSVAGVVVLCATHCSMSCWHPTQVRELRDRSLVVALSFAILIAFTWLRLRTAKQRAADAERKAAEADRQSAKVAGELRIARRQLGEHMRRLRETERRLLLAEHDGLTQVWARGAWARRVEHALDDGVPIVPAVVLIADLDSFKSINDTYGHEVGDRVLRAVAERLQRHFAPDDLIGRWGGDEFVLALQEVPEAEGMERLREEIGRPIGARGVALSVAVSLGMAAVEPGATLDALMRAADTALYQAKRRAHGWTGIETRLAVRRWTSLSTRRGDSRVRSDRGVPRAMPPRRACGLSPRNERCLPWLRRGHR
ncbi:GGDEF domain-containing protein [Promicromonospora sp. MEB111]|uniref:GGDEF domain-containing protein n=1 Tax=Promicromonospora sp. MEB111 TaxID=3040301 RepID=UPI0033067C93